MKYIFTLFVWALSLSAQQSTTASARWQITADFYGTTRYYRLDLDQRDAAHLSGTFSGTKLTGALTGGHLSLSGKADDGGDTRFDAMLQDDALTGTLSFGDPSAPPLVVPFTAILVKPLVRATPQTHEFNPTAYYRQFSPFYKPVLAANPGDTIHTTTVDAGGSDAQNIKRIAGGNPQTGPFYIQGAQPGDTLVVHIDRLKLNRNTAGSDDQLVQSALSPDLAVKTRDNNKGVTWKLDLEHMTASPDPSSEHLKALNVPLHPMLGCIATATSPGGAPPPTGDSGSFGGNMDFNEIAEGATVYLPVVNPGALLYFGDGHALQGDGELNGNALETSMDVTVTVDLISGKRLGFPRVETEMQIIALGYSGYLDDAFKDATSNMADWLMDDYKLTPSEVAQFLGVAAHYRVTEVADRNSGVALKIDKALLKNLSAPQKSQ
ncbi:acetamidase/formamidase [Granulicella aggregans]|uniref:Acetamidase/formamidase n=1 Tax=Granulicella aggregans TaxID=474949 RepID=A0A7W8E1L9_9BACT|nr:acetamidase/formamidase family protein [Granulicella aggregans]MBB5055983.1 acetamidase/formamidase [Granulicella aggregans]